MNLRNPCAVLLVAATSTLGCQKTAAQSPAPAAMTEEQKTVYALGQLMGKNLQAFNLTPAELDLVKQGLADSITNPKAEFNAEAMVPKVQELARARAVVRAAEETKKGQEFADKAAAEPGATKLPSGLVYKSEKEGTGASPGASDISTSW